MIIIKIYTGAHRLFDPCFYTIRLAVPKVWIHEQKDSKTVKAQELLRRRTPPNVLLLSRK
jgi:hypothetical protein